MHLWGAFTILAILPVAARGEEDKEGAIKVLDEFKVIGSVESVYELPGSGTINLKT